MFWVCASEGKHMNANGSLCGRGIIRRGRSSYDDIWDMCIYMIRLKEVDVWHYLCLHFIHNMDAWNSRRRRQVENKVALVPFWGIPKGMYINASFDYTSYILAQVALACSFFGLKKKM